MPKLVLIKHSLPDVRPAHPPSRWRLSAEGMRRAMALAELLRPFDIAALYTSHEPKALQTAALAGERIGVRFQVREELCEHRRDREPFGAQDEFESNIKLMFEKPSERVYGEESAEEALRRFEGAIASILEEAAGGNVAVVAHGTVISLYVAAKCGLDGFELWRRLGLPSYVVLETPGFGVVEVAEGVGDEGNRQRI